MFSFGSLCSIIHFAVKMSDPLYSRMHSAASPSRPARPAS